MFKSLLKFSARSINSFHACNVAKNTFNSLSSIDSQELKGQSSIIVQFKFFILIVQLLFVEKNKDGLFHVPPNMEFEGNWPKDLKQKLLQDMIVIEDFITPDDEKALLVEIEPYLKRMRYERDHWDDAIQGFRETERKSWYPQNKALINRVVERAFPSASSALPHIHVLDLEATGMQKL